MNVEQRPVLVTGGTGTLGRLVVRRLLAQRQSVRVLSRRPRPPEDREPYEWAQGDLAAGRGVDAAVAGVRAVVHCATTLTGKDGAAARGLTGALGRLEAPAPHLVHISIVGIENVPLPYYRSKAEAEQVVAASGLPYTLLRATQFHELVARLTTSQRWLPVLLTPAGVSFQPVDAGEVARRLVDLVSGEPAGRVPDMGGPQVRTARDLARATLAAYGRRRPVVAFRLPGKAFRGYRAGGHLAPERAVGRVTFAEYVAEAAARDTRGAAAF